MHDLGQLLPEDVYTHPEYYQLLRGPGAEPGIRASVAAYQSARGKPEKEVKIYRAVPTKYAHEPIRRGDWVTTSKAYAKAHGDLENEDWTVVSSTAKAKELFQNGDSLNEWGYWGKDKHGEIELAYYPADNSVQQIDTSDVSTPPTDNETVQHIAEILIAGYVLEKTIKLLVKYLTPLGITAAAIRPALGLADHGTKHLPNGKGPASSLTSQARYNDLYYRAAYIYNASRRIQADLNRGKPLRVALSDESLHYRQHEQARRGRLDAAARVTKAAKMFGPLLGWYLNPLLNNEAECIAANGHNFYADEGTVIGLPGSVHPKCGCKAGPPIPGAKMVNEVLSNVTAIGRKFKIKTRKSA